MSEFFFFFLTCDSPRYEGGSQYSKKASSLETANLEAVKPPASHRKSTCQKKSQGMRFCLE
ncbi:unnamed protein product [Chondrus crispus]|uniref:Uncharacterized protein n=1 Tax=Chondrus crispus TaxID=2769 RepID=R7QH83_CHOCR|nr:unnamed protein product [Chondrus crispus]CDF37424.1 unnamed protein product [Chondrus crispus]|eukprot:XP_005717243.1 unnamed protein product [Chondrus crispus]